MQLGERRYELRDGKTLRAQVKRSKIGDGSAVKHILEARLVRALSRRVPLHGKRVFHTSAVDRYGMAVALASHGCHMVLGDFITSLGLPLPIRSIRTIERVAPLVLPWMLRLPTSWVYPTGEQQERPSSRHLSHYVRDADIISGDFHQIRRILPDDLAGKIIVTNTTTAQDVKDLRDRRLGVLATSTPRLGGRTFGTNVMEAMLLTLIDKPQAHIMPEDIENLIAEANLEGNIEMFSWPACQLVVPCDRAIASAR